MGRGGRVIYKRANGNRQRRARRKGADGDEDDDDEEYVLGEGDEEESESSDEPLASSSSSEEEDFDFGSVDSEEELEFEEEDDEEIPRSKPRKKPSSVRRGVKRARDFIDDDEEEEEKTVRKKGRVQFRRRKSRVSDSSEDWEEEEEEEEEGDDEDFWLDEEDEEEEEVSLKSGGKISSRKKGDLKKHGKKPKSQVSRRKKEKKKTAKKRPRKRRKRGKRGTLSEDEEDDDFIVKDRVKVSKKKRDRKKVGRQQNTRLTEPKKRHSVESDTSEFEFLTSDEDDFVTEERIKSKRGRKAKPAGNGVRRRRQRSGSESSDSDYIISEEELRDLGVGGVLDQPQPKKITAGSQVEEKGKEKKTDDSGKQVCGICLSEEQRGTIQGVLNCCAHYFCFACIIEWSKVESRCPVCKRRFETIAKSSRSDPGFGLRNAVIRVQKRDQVYQPSEEEMRGMLDPYENVVCIECQQGGDDSLMLLCDICDSPAHTYCVGLGREVPEGNWYCECCRSAGEGSSHSPVLDTVTHRGPRNNGISGSFETDVPASGHASSNTRRPILNSGQSSSQRIDLNLPPRDTQEEDQGAASQMSWGGASTLSGRRAIQQRIRILLSNSRPRQVSRATVPYHDNGSNSVPLEIQRNQQILHEAEGVNSLLIGMGQSQQNSRPFIQSQSTLAPCIFREENSYRIVEGAKEQVQSMVKNHLKHLSRASLLERANFKDIARRATHTILAACGVKHHRSMVASPVQPPNNCSHELDGTEPAYLVTDCCSSCFRLFVEGVIQTIINTTS